MKLIIKRTIITLIGLATLAALFYAEEDLRGWLAWEHYKHELAAKGEEMDWDKLIPPPAPDGQNFFKAPKLQEWFVRPKPGADLPGVIPGGNYSNELTSGLFAMYKQHPYISSAAIAEVTVLPVSTADAASQNADIVLRYDSHPSPDVRERLVKLFADAIGPNADSVLQSMTILARPPGEIKPVRMVFHSDAPPGTNEMRAFF